MKKLIVIPTYNERENIKRILKRVMAVDPAVEVLVVDDGSPDGTAGIVETIMQNEPRIHILNRTEKGGLGPAYIAGFKWALQRDYEMIMEMDADLSHRPRYLPRFFQAIDETDIVVGSRWMPGGRIANWPIQRVMLSRMASLYCKLILWVPVSDMTAGFVAYRRHVLEALDLDQVRSDGYSFQIEMKYKALKRGFKIREIPITFTDRKEGQSKISRHIVFEALMRVWVLKFSCKDTAPRLKAQSAS